MDNEEIRKLLQELKESSDESSSVRSKIVKIHIDTPEEARRRERAKQRAREKEERRLAEEARKAEAEEEARRLAAQKAAEEAVEEAKREAKSGFAPDLDEDLFTAAATHQEAEASEEDASDSDLNLNWGYEVPELKSGLVSEEDLDLGPAQPGRGPDAARNPDKSGLGFEEPSKQAGKAGENGMPGEGEPLDEAAPDHAARSWKKRFGWLRSAGVGEDEGYESDESDFRSEEEDLPGQDAERESITGLPGRFGALSDGVLSFFGGVHRSVKEDLSKARERRTSSKEDGKAEDDPESVSGAEEAAESRSGAKNGRGSAAKQESGLQTDQESPAQRRHARGADTHSEPEYGVLVGADPQPDPGKNLDWVRKASPDPSKEMHELPSYWSEEEGEDGESGLEGLYPEDGPDRAGRTLGQYGAGGADRAHGNGNWDDGEPGGTKSGLHEFPSGKPDAGRGHREYGPDEEWKRRMEEAPRKKTFFQKLKMERVASVSIGGGRKKKKEDRSAKEEAEAEDPLEKAEALETADGVKVRTAAGRAGEREDTGWTKTREEAAQDKDPAAAFRSGETPRKEEAFEAAEETAEEAVEETAEEEALQTAETSGKPGWFGKLKRTLKGEKTEPGKEPDDAYEPDKEPDDAYETESASDNDDAYLNGRGDKRSDPSGPEDAPGTEEAAAPEKAPGLEETSGTAPGAAPAAPGVASAAPGTAPGAAPGMALGAASGTVRGAATGTASAAPETTPGAAPVSGSETDPDEADLPKSIEVIDLNENQNNKDVRVIPLTGDTGALPDSAQLKKEARLRRRKKKASRGGDSGSANGAGIPGSSRAGAFFQSHKKGILIAIVILALAAAAAVAGVLLSGRMGQQPRETITADEGLTVRVLEQPDSYTRSGDVQIRIKAPETIQSVTVNGENVVIDQGRTVEFSYHASGGTLDLMAVSTDKVRNAKVVLAYVDSQAPTVTVREEGGKIVLDAEDTESGLEGIYIGNASGLSDIPQYEEYSEPLEKNPDREITYYAKDLAGNTTTPVVVALTPAESIAFSTERYNLFPGSVERVSLVTTPEHAFVNNLKLESENPKVVQIEGDMQIRGLVEGDTRITATADGIAGVMAGVSVLGERKVKISAIGDCTLGTDASFSQNTSFNAFEALYGGSYFFEKVKGILGSGDSAFANLEGTLTTSEEREQKTFAFKGDPSYAKILADAGIDVVTLANNHSRDYGEQSLIDTQHALEEAGVEWCMGDHIAYRDLNGILTAYIGIYALENGLDTLPQVKSTIAEAKKKGADLIIIEFHWGAELVREIDEFQKELAHTAVDEGADLVLGSHAHVLQGIEKYKDAYIVYGLSNFCFGGNSDPTSYDTIIWQQTFTFSSDGLEKGDDIAIIPCHVSGDLSSNNYQPVPVSGDAAATIMKTIDDLSAQFGQSYSAYMVDGTLWTDSGKQTEN